MSRLRMRHTYSGTAMRSEPLPLAEPCTEHPLAVSRQIRRAAHELPTGLRPPWGHRSGDVKFASDIEVCCCGGVVVAAAAAGVVARSLSLALAKAPTQTADMDHMVRGDGSTHAPNQLTSARQAKLWPPTASACRRPGFCLWTQQQPRPRSPARSRRRRLRCPASVAREPRRQAALDSPPSHTVPATSRACAGALPRRADLSTHSDAHLRFRSPSERPHRYTG